MTQKDVVTILAIIGALVVLGLVLRVTFALIGPLLILALGFVAYKMIQNKGGRSEEHTSELQSLMRISYAVFCLKKKKTYEQINKMDMSCKARPAQKQNNKSKGHRA